MNRLSQIQDVFRLFQKDLVQKYQAEGFEYFRWITNYDGRERPLHAELGKKTNNKYGINEN